LLCSIQQGGVASRPGHEYDAFLGRALNREIYNFGFAGNGVMELSVAEYLTMLSASAIVIDCLPNMNAAEVANRTVPLVAYLRAHNHSTTPIVLVEGSPSAPFHLYGNGVCFNALRGRGGRPGAVWGFPVGLQVVGLM
jgi:hypothetical protein